MSRQSRDVAILLTRPAEQSRRFALSIRQALSPDVQIIISPLLEPIFLDSIPLYPEAGALLLTSQTAVEAARRLLAQGVPLPGLAYCVGPRTAAAATSLGMQAISAEGDADALIARVIADDVAVPLLHLHGTETVGNVADRLNSAGLVTFSVPCYQQQPQTLNEAAIALLGKSHPVILPLFSPRSARLFASEAHAHPPMAPLFVAALSLAVAKGLAPLQPHRLNLASAPNACAMVTAVRDLFAAASRA